MKLFFNNKTLTLAIIILISNILFAQSTLTGEVKNDKGAPQQFASVSILNTTDVTTTDAAGKYTLKTTSKGNQVLVISALGFTKINKPIVLADTTYTYSFVLKQDATRLDEVVISAGSIQASNDRTVAVLDPLDIVTTAGAQGDIVGAIQTLPGVQRNGGDQTGLQVRGGDVNESIIIIDGTISQNAYNSAVPGVAQRSRFNPFQFKGTAFSTGGYSVRYGQALSSVLDLQTNDLPEKSNVNIGLNMAGVQLSGSKLMGKNAVEYSGYYTNLAPYFAITPTSVNFYDVPQGGGISTRFVSRTENNGIFKMGLTQTYNKSGIAINDPANAGQFINFGLANENTYLTTSYKNWLSENCNYSTAFSYSNNTDNIKFGTAEVYRHDNRVQGRAELFYKFGKKLNFFTGVEAQRFGYEQRFDTLIGQFDELLSAAYLEIEYKPIRWFAVKPSVRGEYSKLIARSNISPRISMAVKTGLNSQISAASGVFYQNASSNYYLFGYRPKFQQAIHYLLNYQWGKTERTFRLEGYYKSYDQLVRENGVPYNPNQFRFNYGQVDNSGYGYAQGFDLFWRDKKSIKNFDYWISYSYVDTKRLYQNYTTLATPDYVSDHNLNIIMKYFWEKLQTNFSFTYSYASGRPYYDPNSTDFLSNRAPEYNNLALTVSYLTTIKKFFTVFYLSFDNIANTKNVLGYRYSQDGLDRYPINPAIYRSIFVGVNLSLSEFNKDEL